MTLGTNLPDQQEDAIFATKLPRSTPIPVVILLACPVLVFI
jgi:hypothetical protein